MFSLVSQSQIRDDSIFVSDFFFQYLFSFPLKVCSNREYGQLCLKLKFKPWAKPPPSLFKFSSTSLPSHSLSTLARIFLTPFAESYSSNPSSKVWALFPRMLCSRVVLNQTFSDHDYHLSWSKCEPISLLAVSDLHQKESDKPRVFREGDFHLFVFPIQ